jgi:hypothetical protein
MRPETQICKNMRKLKLFEVDLSKCLIALIFFGINAISTGQDPQQRPPQGTSKPVKLVLLFITA